MTSIRETILTKISTLCAGLTSIEGRSYRSRPSPVVKAESPMIIVEAVQDTADYSNLTHMTWRLEVRVNVFTRGAAPDQLADPILTELYEVLMADRTLEGYALDLVPLDVRFVIDEGDQTVGVSSARFLVTYRTLQDSMEE